MRSPCRGHSRSKEAVRKKWELDSTWNTSTYSPWGVDSFFLSSEQKITQKCSGDALCGEKDPVNLETAAMDFHFLQELTSYARTLGKPQNIDMEAFGEQLQENLCAIYCQKYIKSEGGELSGRGRQSTSLNM